MPLLMPLLKMVDPAILKRLDAAQHHLGPHAKVLVIEMLSAARAGLHATLIIQASAVLDVMLREPSGRPAEADGVDLAAARDSRDAFWLRQRRNGLVHYEGGQGGMMGDDADISLARDADRALKTVIEAIDLLVWGVD